MKSKILRKSYTILTGIQTTDAKRARLTGIVIINEYSVYSA